MQLGFAVIYVQGNYMNNLRFHLIALSTLILVVILVFAVTGQFGSKAPTASEPQAARTIKIWEASWGINCVDAPLLDDKGPALERRELAEIVKNNVLETVAKACDGKVSCDFSVEEQALGNVSRGRRCQPELNIIYRCYDLDRPSQVVVKNGNNAVLKCNNDSAL
jgi:hypothetical protein